MSYSEIFQSPASQNPSDWSIPQEIGWATGILMQTGMIPNQNQPMNEQIPGVQIPGQAAQKPWYQWILDLLKGGSGTTSASSGMYPPGAVTAEPGQVRDLGAQYLPGTGEQSVNLQALSGPLNVSDLWRFILALVLFVIVANAVPGNAGVYFGVLVLLGAMAYNKVKATQAIQGFADYLQGKPYNPGEVPKK